MYQYNNTEYFTSQDLETIFKVDRKTIMRNFQRNIAHYTEGKHYIKLQGASLKQLKTYYSQDSQLKFVSVLILWSEAGVNLLAKSLTKNTAWQHIGD